MTYISKKQLENIGKISYEENENKSYIKESALIETELMNLKILNTKVENGVYLNIINNQIKQDFKYESESEKEFLQLRIILQGSFQKLCDTHNSVITYKENYVVIDYKAKSKTLLLYKKNEHIKYLCISLGESFLKENKFLDDILKNKINNNPFIELFLPELKFKYNELFEKDYSNRVDKIYLKNITMELIFFIFQKIQKKSSLAYTLDEDEVQRIYKVKEILEKSFKDKLTISKLAKEVALNQTKLKIGFKELFHSTIHDYLVEIRLTKATEYLKDKHYSIKEVSEMVGYTNQCSFTFAFSKKYHCSPKNFQKNN